MQTYFSSSGLSRQVDMLRLMTCKLARVSKQMFLICWGLISLLCSAPIFAESLGNYGNVYEIAEPDGINALKNEAAKNLQGDKKNRLIDGAKKRYIYQLEHLNPIPGIAKVASANERYVDPTQVVTNNIYGPKGDLIARKGQRINPLVTSPLSKRLIFIDARDQNQINLAAKIRRSQDKVILVAGNLLDTGKQLRTQVYYDLGGVFVKRLQIRAVPSVASQVSDKLLIQEIAP